MPVISAHKDSDALTMTFVAEFDAGVDRVWRVWEDPRRLEQWWGPPQWPATFTKHEFVVGGICRYHMTGPDGTKAPGWWTITAIEAPHRLEFDDGFAGDDGEPSTAIPPTHAVVTLEAVGDRTRMTAVTKFASLESLEQMAAMGMEEGMTQAMGQIDEVLR
jgi:uncharacterized protein YndB with AHSA1/START domain